MQCNVCVTMANKFLQKVPVSISNNLLTIQNNFYKVILTFVDLTIFRERAVQPFAVKLSFYDGTYMYVWMTRRRDIDVIFGVLYM